MTYSAGVYYAAYVRLRRNDLLKYNLPHSIRLLRQSLHPNRFDQRLSASSTLQGPSIQMQYRRLLPSSRLVGNLLNAFHERPLIRFRYHTSAHFRSRMSASS